MKHQHLLAVCVVAIIVAGCMEQKESRPIGEILGLKGKSTVEVQALLGEPRVVDTTATSREQIWGYYQMLVTGENETEPRQRTVLIVFRRDSGDFRVDEVRIP